MQNIHSKIGSEELSLGIQSDEFQEELNFGLVNVVYEWAINKVNKNVPIISMFAFRNIEAFK